MACRTIPLAGGFAVLCGPRTRRKPCSVPNCGKPSTKLCDGAVVRKGLTATCDAKLCDRCATSFGPDRDMCPPHAARERAKETTP